MTRGIRKPALTAVERSEIRRLRALRVPISHMARQLKRTETTVGRYIRRWEEEHTSTVEDAKAHLRAHALPMARRVVEQAKPELCVQVLKDKEIGVLTPDGSGAGLPSVLIAVGMGTGQAGLMPPLDRIANAKGLSDGRVVPHMGTTALVK